MISKISQLSEKYLINIQDYKIVGKLKKGGFGVIFLVQNKKDGSKFAAKINIIPNNKQNILFISREVYILMQIQHPTIIEFHGFSFHDFDNQKNVTILMKYMKNGSLADLIAKEEMSLCPSDYDDTKRQKILIGIARGMMILHKHQIIHRDLKPENVLLDDDFNPRITDFGLSKFYNPYNSMYQSCAKIGTASYMAPEVIKSNHFNTKADVYAFGILMYEVLNGKRVNNCNRPEIDPKSMRKNHMKMIEKCLSENPRERPTFSEIYRKLSLTPSNGFFEFENNYEVSIISDDEDDEDEGEENEEINTKFCIKSVDYNDIIDYVEEINIDAKTGCKEEESRLVKYEDVENLKNQFFDELRIKTQEIKELKEKTSELKTEQTKEIEELRKKIDEIKAEKTKEIEELKKETLELKNEKTKEIDELKKETHELRNEKNKEIEGLKKETLALRDEKTKEIEELKKETLELRNEKNKEIEELKKETLELRNEKTKEIEELKKETLELRNEKNKEIEELKKVIFELKNEKNKEIEELKKVILELKNETTILKEEVEMLKGNIINQNEIIETNDENKDDEIIQKLKTSSFLSFVQNDFIENAKMIPYENGKEFNGIIKYLTQQTGGNIHDNHTIEVSSNSVLSLSKHPKNLLDFNSKEAYASQINSKDVFVCFDFKKMKISISHYSIKSDFFQPDRCHIKSWIMQISEDGENWISVDEHENYGGLNGPGIIKTFEVTQEMFSRYCRLKCEYYGFGISLQSIEFYGSIYEP